jgi:hypothetical protein
LWARDVRGGAGERQIFRDIVRYLVVHDPQAAWAVIAKIPEVGRWDDLLVVEGPLQMLAFGMIAQAFGPVMACVPNGCPAKAKWRSSCAISLG